MSESMDRPFSRFYAQLRRAAGEVPDDQDVDDERKPEWIGAPDLANPKSKSAGRDADED